MNSKTISIKELIESGNPPEILFWVGCAGSYDERYKKVTKIGENIHPNKLKNKAKILNELNKLKPSLKWVIVGEVLKV